MSELQRLRLLRRATTLKGSAALLGLAAFVVFVLLIEFVSAPSNSPTGIAATAIATLSIVLGIPVSIAIANDYFKRAGVVRRQLLSSEVLVCEGTVDDIVAPPKELENIRREVGSSSDVVLELLVPSGLVWRVNGRHSTFWTIAPTGRTAETPELARFAAQFVRAIETDCCRMRSVGSSAAICRGSGSQQLCF